jgi:hypothetical protein
MASCCSAALGCSRRRRMLSTRLMCRRNSSRVALRNFCLFPIAIIAAGSRRGPPFESAQDDRASSRAAGKGARPARPSCTQAPGFARSDSRGRLSPHKSKADTSGVPTARGCFHLRAHPPVNWRAIVGGPSGTNGGRVLRVFGARGGITSGRSIASKAKAESSLKQRPVASQRQRTGTARSTRADRQARHLVLTILIVVDKKITSESVTAGVQL